MIYIEVVIFLYRQQIAHLHPEHPNGALIKQIGRNLDFKVKLLKMLRIFLLLTVVLIF